MSKTIYGRSSVNLTVDSLTFLSITANDINATNASITNIDGTNLTYTNGTFTTANVSTLNVSDLNIDQISFGTANVSTLNASQINSSNGSITTLSGTDLIYTNASINTSLNCCDIDAFRIQLSGAMESNGISNFGDLVQVGPLEITGGTGLLDMNGKNISDAGIIEATTVNVSTVNASDINLDTIDLTTANVSTGNISTLNTSSIFSTGQIQSNQRFRSDQFVSRDITPIVIINSSNGSTTLNASSINCSFTTTMNTLETNNANASTVNSSTGNFSTLNASSFALSTIDLTTANISTANVSTLNISGDTNSSGSFTIPESEFYNVGNSYIQNNGTNIQLIGNNRAINLVGQNGSTARSSIYITGTITLTDAPVRIRDDVLDMNNNNINNVSQITYNFCRANLGSFGSTTNFNRSFIGDLSRINEYTDLPWNASLVEQLGEGLVVGQTYGNADILYTANSNTEGIRWLNTSNINGSNFNINMSLTRDANLYVRTSIDAPTINASTLNVDTVFNVSTNFQMGQGSDGTTSLVNTNASIQFASNTSGTPFTAPIFTLGTTKAVLAITDFEVLNGNLNMATAGSTGRAIFRTNGQIYMNSGETEFRIEANGARDVVIVGNEGEASETTLTIGSNVNCSNGAFVCDDVRPFDAVNPYNAWNSFAMNTTGTGQTPPTFLWGQGVHIDKDSGFQNLYYSHNQIVQWVSADKAFRLTNNNREGQYEVEATVQVRNSTSNRANFCIGIALNDDTDVGNPSSPRIGEELNGFSPFSIAYTRMSEGMRTTLRAKRIMKIDDTTDRISINTYVANGGGTSLADTQNSEVFNTVIKFTYIGNYTLQTAIYQ